MQDVCNPAAQSGDHHSVRVQQPPHHLCAGLRSARSRAILPHVPDRAAQVRAGSTGSAPRSAGPKASPTARSRPGPSKPRPTTGRPARPTTSCASRISSSATSRRRSGKPSSTRSGFIGGWCSAARCAVLEGQLAVRHIHHLSASDALVEALVHWRRALFRKGLRRSASPLCSASGGRRALRRAARQRAEIHRKADLRALSAVRHDLDLAVLTPPAAGMGRADRALRRVSRQGREQKRGRGDRAGRPQLGLVPGNRDPGARAEARSRGSAGTARAWCC